MAIGIYKITNPSGKIYIGQSSNLEKRIHSYKNINNSKKQKKLHNSLITHGIHNHNFEVIKICSIEKLNFYERYYQDYFNCIGENGLNLLLQHCENKKQVHCIDVINKISNSMKKKHQDPEYQKKQRVSKPKKRMTEEAKQKLRLTRKPKDQYGNKFASKSILDTKYDITYTSALEASILLNINYSTFKNKLQGKTNCKRFIYLKN